MTLPTLPPEAAGILRPVLPALADETIAAIAREVPDYERAMEGYFGRAVRMGVEVALTRFVDELVGGTTDEAGARETYVELGRGEYHAGRSLDALLAAYRLGARLTWRRFVEAGTAGGLPPRALYDLGEAIFAYIDELSAESVEGYAEAQSAAAGESLRRRRRLVRLLAQEPPASAEAVRTAARDAGWVLPRRVAAIVAALPGEAPAAAGWTPAPPGDGAPGDPAAADGALDAHAARLARRTGAGAIGGAVGALAVVLVPDPDAPGRRRTLAAAVGDGPAVLGPAVSWTRAAVSVRRAAATFRLAVRGALGAPAPARATAEPAAGLYVAEEHLAALLLAADTELAAELARVRLAPLAGLAPAARSRLEATLRAYVDRPGQVQAIAAALGVHPQTVRYRIKQLRDRFGTRLEDPEERFELALALRAADGLRADGPVPETAGDEGVR